MLTVQIWECGKRVPVLEPLTLMARPLGTSDGGLAIQWMGQCTNIYDLSSWQVRQFAALVALVVRILVLGFYCI